MATNNRRDLSFSIERKKQGHLVLKIDCHRRIIAQTCDETMVYTHTYWLECPGPALDFLQRNLMRADVIALKANEICRLDHVSTDLVSNITGYSTSSEDLIHWSLIFLFN